MFWFPLIVFLFLWGILRMIPWLLLLPWPHLLLPNQYNAVYPLTFAKIQIQHKKKRQVSLLNLNWTFSIFHLSFSQKKNCTTINLFRDLNIPYLLFFPETYPNFTISKNNSHLLKLTLLVQHIKWNFDKLKYLFNLPVFRLLECIIYQGALRK